MNKYIVVPISSLYELDVYFNRRRKQGYKIKRSILNFVILEKVDKVEGKYVMFDEEHEDIELVMSSRHTKLGYTLNNNIQSKKVSESKHNALELSMGVLVSVVASSVLVFLIMTSSGDRAYLKFAIYEVLLIIMTLFGINNVIDLIKLMKKEALPVSRFDVARKSVQFLALFLGLVFIVMSIATSIIPVSESTVVIHYFIWLGLFVFSAGVIIVKLYENAVQAMSMVLLTAILFFFFQSILYMQLLMHFIASIS